MARETREFTTPGGSKVVLRTYLNGREKQSIKAAVYSSMKMNVNDMKEGDVSIDQLSGSFVVEQEQKALSYLLVSVNGNMDNPVEALLDLPATEYDAVVEEINKITNPTSPESSEQLGTGPSQAA
ncbi:hypothetical protein [Rhodopseudomonas palustris]|uniref:hypothetical protein n=1 Tax=Rhodopseudomonas palustris TaxID=1076 RepID=UPI000D1AFCC8|nr:hypothetical protein [Rhodopseudomonas palustris]AVT83664.1 hypothetical protein RPYSC3_48040 [Rhodopseudomonas palustris]